MYIPEQRETLESVDPFKICRREDFNANPRRYVGAEGGLVVCMGRFGLSAAACHKHFAVDTVWGDGDTADALQVEELASSHGCSKRVLGSLANEAISSEYL